MSRPVHVLTDSASDLDPEDAAALGCTVIPVPVYFGSDAYEDRVTITPEVFFQRLQSEKIVPKTSQPTPTAIATALQRLVDAGHDVLMLCMSGRMSSTAGSARQIAERLSRDHIVVVDTLQISFSEQVVVRAVVNYVRSGASLEEAVRYAEEVRHRAHILGVLRTLEYLQRNGRIGRVAGVVGGLLSLKIVVGVEDGVLSPVDRVRTWPRALQSIEDLVVGSAPFEGPIIIGHAANREDAEALLTRLKERLPEPAFVLQEIGPVVGAHSGPGAVGVAFLQEARTDRA